jgi:hypothetical protein
MSGIPPESFVPRLNTKRIYRNFFGLLDALRAQRRCSSDGKKMVAFNELPASMFSSHIFLFFSFVSG